MNFFLDRTKFTETGTFGVITCEDDPFINGLNGICYTLELPWLDNHPQTSCIPKGVYKCVKHDSPAHPNTWEVTGVPDRSAILIHTGNTMDDSKGCILVGDSKGKIQNLSAVFNSKKTMEKLRGILPGEFTLTIEEV